MHAGARASDVLLACEFSGRRWGHRTVSDAIRRIAARAWRAMAPRSPSIRRRSGAISEGYRRERRSCLTAAAACGGWGEAWRRAEAARHSMDAPVRGAGFDGYTRHRDRGADSGGRHGDEVGEARVPVAPTRSFSRARSDSEPLHVGHARARRAGRTRHEADFGLE